MTRQDSFLAIHYKEGHQKILKNASRLFAKGVKVDIDSLSHPIKYWANTDLPRSLPRGSISLKDVGVQSDGLLKSRHPVENQEPVPCAEFRLSPSPPVGKPSGLKEMMEVPPRR